MIDKRSKSKSKSKDQSRIRKKKSTLNNTKANVMEGAGRETNKDRSGGKKKKNEKSKTKFKKVSIGGAMKSKGSTTMIQTNKINLGKKK